MCRLFVSVFSQQPWNDRWESDTQATDYLLDLVDNRNSLCFGFYVQEQLIGLSLGYIFNWWEGKELFIKEFCIHRQYQKQGYGKAFMADIESRLRDMAIKTVWLSTGKHTPAFRFYQRCGFTTQDDFAFLAKNI
ncbi:MAG: GNAT family N-acetyltransferase [Chitinivibrionales bacterium]